MTERGIPVPPRLTGHRCRAQQEGSTTLLDTVGRHRWAVRFTALLGAVKGVLRYE